LGDQPNETFAFTGIFPGASLSMNVQLEQYIKINACSHHAILSCPLSSDDDPMAVLGSKFRARGMNG
jgi:hypothetical protein